MQSVKDYTDGEKKTDDDNDETLMTTRIMMVKASLLVSRNCQAVLMMQLACFY